MIRPQPAPVGVTKVHLKGVPMLLRCVALIAVTLAFGGVVAACGDDDEESEPSTTAATTVSEEEAAATAAAVTQLQQVMTDLGYYSGPIDGIYGPETTAGVEAMQEDLGVTVDGIYGPETHEALGEQATSIIIEIQTALAEYGYYTGEIDGVYGPETTAAVEQLQEDLGVTVDGRFGPETAAAFDEAVANGELEPV
jgi:peptidoglycan hydrolase-like protein with peptidoglycan-binding domain